MPTPNLGAYDSRKFRASDLHMPDQMAPDFKAALSFDKDYPSTRDADYATLVALGVNGEVPLAQAMRNAGLASETEEYVLRGRVSLVFDVPANDNHEQAAIAA